MIRPAAVSACRALGAAFVRAPTTTTAAISTAPSLAMAPSSALHDEQQNIRWRFPADDRMQSMIARCKHGMSLGNILTLNSKAPITPGLFEEAFEHLYDKVESLRLCCRFRDGQPWVADMQQRKLDLQVVSGPDLEEVYQAHVKQSFNLHDGPLWKALLMHCPADAPCPAPEVKAAFPHQCHVLLLVHHAFMDGISIATISEVLFLIIDSLLDGATENLKPIGEMRDGVEAREEEDRIRVELLSDSERLLIALRRYSMSKHLPLLMEAYGIPNETNPYTSYLDSVVLDKQMVERLAAKCRSIRATLSTGFTAVLNVAMMEMVREAGLKRDVYHISTKHPVDTRRLMKNWKKLPLGFHVIPFIQYTATPHDAKKNFWDYVDHMNTELRAQLERNSMCEQRVLEVLMRPEGYTHEARYISRHLPENDNLISFVYSPKAPQNQGVGKNVRQTMFAVKTDFHMESNMIATGILPGQNQVLFQMAYSTAAVSGEVIKRYFEKCIATLHDVTKAIK